MNKSFSNDLSRVLWGLIVRFCDFDSLLQLRQTSVLLRHLTSSITEIYDPYGNWGKHGPFFDQVKIITILTHDLDLLQSRQVILPITLSSLTLIVKSNNKAEEDEDYCRVILDTLILINGWTWKIKPNNITVRVDNYQVEISPNYIRTNIDPLDLEKIHSVLPSRDKCIFDNLANLRDMKNAHHYQYSNDIIGYLKPINEPKLLKFRWRDLYAALYLKCSRRVEYYIPNNYTIIHDDAPLPNDIRYLNSTYADNGGLSISTSIRLI